MFEEIFTNQGFNTITENILINLDVKSLWRCRLVCKALYQFIKSLEKSIKLKKNDLKLIRRIRREQFFQWIFRIILKSFSFNFLLFSSDLMNWCKALQTNRHLQRLSTFKLIRMFSVMWLNPWFVKISSNILNFVLILVLLKIKSIARWPAQQLVTWKNRRLRDFWIMILWFFE